MNMFPPDQVTDATTRLEPLFFSPSSVSGQLLLQILNNSFADSFEHLFDACTPHVNVPQPQAGQVVSRLRNGSRETPYLFSLHFKLIDAIQADALDEVEGTIATICQLPPAGRDIITTDLRPDAFPWDAEVVAKYFNLEEDSVYRYGPPDSKDVPPRARQVKQALELLRRTVPGLADEFETLITTIILAGGKPLNEFAGNDFGGASALRAFGSILQNVRLEPSLVEAVASLVHEETHNLLFALSPMEGVVENDDEDRFASPLRDDPRPMEGIFHATFVLARMVYCMDAMCQSGQLDKKEMSDAHAVINGSVPLFNDGLDIVEAHGILTPQGKAAMQAAKSYMTCRTG